MPTYEYTCRDCGHTFDIVQKMSDDALTRCPECGGDLRKVFAAPAISFRGSGFYATDHGKKTKTSAAEDKKDGGSKDAGSDTKKTETKTSDTKGDTGSGSSSSSSTGKKEGSS